MIGEINNVYVRRAVLVVAFPIAFTLDILIAVAVSVQTTCSDAIKCWRGSAQ